MIVATTIAGVACVVSSPTARADDSVTYEVFSDDIPSAFIEYRDGSGKKYLDDVPLPWRTTVTVVDPFSPTADGSELSADWRALARFTSALDWPKKWVTVRISYHGDVICESTLNVGNATCYGSAPHRSESKSSPGNLP
ncbi:MULTISPECIES: hypothetical protein [unclassified Mycobacterium]|uniref:hypothetical protein n=1 Tax=unclassified Mycobacterium TaxID=2642494 RepID=UPI0009E9EC51|nr:MULTISPECIES: hypothetical protein [unclassified Mycobacterium]